MDQRTSAQLAAILGGEAWQCGPDAYQVAVYREDGSLVVWSENGISEFESDEDFDAKIAAKTIQLDVPDPEELYVISDGHGNVFFLNDSLQRGWRYEEDARREVRALQSRGEGRFTVIRQSEIPA